MTAERAPADQVSWHDNLIYAIQIVAPDPENRDWRNDLVFDIDHIVDWFCGTDGRAKFRVAPATLVFHDVTNLRVRLEMGVVNGHAQSLNELSIGGISRKPIPHPGSRPSLPYYNWRIRLNVPASGELEFGASGYTQTLRAEPLLLDEQRLSPRDRPHLAHSRTALPPA